MMSDLALCQQNSYLREAEVEVLKVRSGDEVEIAEVVLADSM